MIAPEVSGAVMLSVSGLRSDGTPIPAITVPIDVKVGGLAALAESPPDYNLIGATAGHLNNHFASFPMNSALISIAKEYAAAFPGSILSYNDMSLVEGGVFDAEISGVRPPKAYWAPPHCGHSSLGGGTNNVDVAMVPTLNRALLEQIIIQNGGRVCVKHSNHWHLCF
jgi:hypothetical protein